MDCRLDLWQLRAWARAVGGFENMSRDLRAALVTAERACDEDAIVVEHSWAKPQAVVGKVEWQHVDFLHPGSTLPHMTIWRSLCQVLSSGVARLPLATRSSVRLLR